MLGAYLVQSRIGLKFKDPSFRWSNGDEVGKEGIVVERQAPPPCPMTNVPRLQARAWG